jgi:YfiH family protein
MLLHNDPHLRIYFGDAQDKLFPADYLNLPPDADLFSIPNYARMLELLHLKNLVFLHQTHSTDGLVITSSEHAQQIRPFFLEGDYLVTNQPLIGVGVMTADCLPVVLYDSVHQAVAVVHAGWRGSVQGVVLTALEVMKENFGTKPEQLTVFFGPCAQVCCYEVGQDFLDNLEDFDFIDRVACPLKPWRNRVQRRDSKLFFDVPLYNQLLLESVGVPASAFQEQYNKCTMCDHAFFSHRRQGQAAGRQMTVACLQ